MSESRSAPQHNGVLAEALEDAIERLLRARILMRRGAKLPDAWREWNLPPLRKLAAKIFDELEAPSGSAPTEPGEN